MKPRRPWSLTLLAALSLAVAAASCSAAGTRASSSGTSGSKGTGGAGNGGASSSSGSLSTDGGPGDAASDQQIGPTTCDSSCETAGGQCMSGTCVLSQNPGNLSSGTRGTLVAGGNGDPSFAWLYPYDQTVFPRGLIPPTLQFGGNPPDAVYVHVTFPGMDYQGFYGASNPGRVVFTPAVWAAITLAAGAASAVRVDVTKVTGGVAAGPLTETWTIAQGSLRGTIYYETYDSALAGGLGSVGIMQIQPGAAAPTVLKSGCGNVCHTASADGSTLVAAQSLLSSASYDLKTSASAIYDLGGDGFTYGGIYPDGSFVVAATGFRTWLGNPSRLYSTATGANIPTPSWDSAITNGGTTAFSPDGKQIAFNHEDTGGGATMAVMAFDHATMTFSGLHDVADHPGLTVAWPAFTPDGKWVVYHAGSDAAFETDLGATGDLYVTSAASKTQARLDALDGYTGSGTATYLPDQDTGLSFAPTVLPEAVGGYFWVVFTSHRSYGNILPSMQEGPDGADEYGKLWVAAFDINAAAGTDPSHPAFYLDGQEADADNLRGFWVLNPCQANSSACASGDDCCGGYCRGVDGGPQQCVPPPVGGCSEEYELCTTAANCCTPGSQCINGRCALPPPG